MREEQPWPRSLLYRQVGRWLAELAMVRVPSIWTIGLASDLHHIAEVLRSRAAHHPHLKRRGVELHAFSTPPASAEARAEAEGALARAGARAPDLHLEVTWSEPPGQVDLVAVRFASRPCFSWKRTLDSVRPGGRLLLDEPPDEETPSMVALDRAGMLLERPPSGAPGRIDAIVADHVGLARSLARRFANRGESYEELEQVAMAALVACAHRYDPARGVAFAGFASSAILGELKRHFRDRTWAMRVPRSLQDTYLALKKGREELVHSLGRSPDVRELASYLGTTTERVLEALEAADSYWPSSLDAARSGEEDAPAVPFEDPGFEAAVNREQLCRLTPSLSAKERVVLKGYFFDGMTQQQLAEELGISQMNVSRTMARAVARLRAGFYE